MTTMIKGYTDKRFAALAALGAGEFVHLNGTLIAHLTGTLDLLKAWGAADYVCDAGLFHAAYGTAGFDETMVSLTQRAKIVDVIGEAAEALVYLYCSCDRAFVFERKIGKKPIKFKDRFTGECFVLDDQQASAFCELTVANELELLLTSKAFVDQYGAELLVLFEDIQHYVSEAGVKAFQDFFATAELPK